MPLIRRVRSVVVSEDAKEAALAAAEADRVEAIDQRRLYYEGKQYDAQNADLAKSLNVDSLAEVPEHKKKHAYSTQIGECVDFLADRLGEGFQVIAADDRVQDVLDAMVASSEVLAAENEDGDVEIVTDDLLREAAQAGDVAVHLAWDPVEQRVYPEFWEAEHVEFRMADTRTVEKVVRTEVVWRTDDVGDYREVTERVEYHLAMNEAGHLEARADTYWDEDEDPRDQEWLGHGRIPWCLLRIDKKRLRSFRGDSLITDQVMRAADRYNGIEQIAFLIARYNSHGNLVVIGDGASLKLEADGRISKDVADVLTFPGGTQAVPISLPSDPQMIEHQRKVLSESIYATFGLTRQEPDALVGLGGVTGYALEILNQKSEVTYKRVARRWRKDLTSMLGLALDIAAWKLNAQYGTLDPETGLFTVAPDEDALIAAAETGIPMVAWWEIDPMDVFPNRTVEIRMGSGYIVDEVKIRDDFVAGLISREEALRQRGVDDTEIGTIVDEINEQARREAEIGGGETGVAGPTRTSVPGAGSTNGVKSGSTVASSTART